MATERAKRVYLAFFEIESDNAGSIAHTIRCVIDEAGKAGPRNAADLYDVLYTIADELEDPNLLTEIYGEPDEL